MAVDSFLADGVPVEGECEEVGCRFAGQKRRRDIYLLCEGESVSTLLPFRTGQKARRRMRRTDNWEASV